MDRFQQALSRKEEGGFLRLKSLKGEKTENRLTKTQNQHIFSIETTNIMMYIWSILCLGKSELLPHLNKYCLC